ncbi:MurR/RpiR family transcriptional regulator [Brevibacterium casei]|uniref:MurR/RpiR family transcriptional regulator n=1 Tax=Brevibacterium casei TaxID=33889 RepID=UPI00223B1EBA|nr:MurR/RpiR family transcriptional regulator [Brevibacterium casei]MCT1765554.1 MurR/RpiR family transcriptional regulator [Brevibacterium casei]
MVDGRGQASDGGGAADRRAPTRESTGTSSLAVTLRTVMPELTPAEKKIARALLASYPLAGLEPIADLAYSAGVSAPSVVRFARTLGFDGYRGLQDALKVEMREREESNLSQAEVSRAGDEPVFEAARRGYHAGIDETFDSVIGDEFDRAVTLFAQAKRTMALVGASYTGYVADIFHAQLAPLRPGVTRLSSSPLLAATELVDLRRGDLLVVFDVRRYEPMIAEVVRIGKEMGLTTVVFTDLWLSPAAALADHVLTADVRASGPADTFAPMLALVEAVCELVAAELGQESVDRLARIDPVRLRLRGNIDRL